METRQKWLEYMGHKDRNKYKRAQHDAYVEDSLVVPPMAFHRSSPQYEQNECVVLKFLEGTYLLSGVGEILPKLCSGQRFIDDEMFADYHR